MNRAFRVDFKGPFFQRDPIKMVKANITAMMDALGQEGERDVRSQIAALPMAHSTGHTAAHVRGRVRSLTGKPWKATAVVSVQVAGMTRAKAIRTKAAASSIEGRWHPFRKTTAAMKRSRAVIAADLTKGLE